MCEVYAELLQLSVKGLVLGVYRAAPVKGLVKNWVRSYRVSEIHCSFFLRSGSFFFFFRLFAVLFIPDTLTFLLRSLFICDYFGFSCRRCIVSFFRFASYNSSFFCYLAFVLLLFVPGTLTFASLCLFYDFSCISCVTVCEPQKNVSLG